MKTKSNILGVLAVALSMALTACNDAVEHRDERDSNTKYKVTIFVQEVLEDGTLSYTREFYTTETPVFWGYYKSGPHVRIGNMDIIAPCIIEKVD